MDENKQRAGLDNPIGDGDEFNEIGSESELGGKINENEAGEGINEGDDGLGGDASQISEEVGGDTSEISEVGDDAGEISEGVGSDAGDISEEVGGDAGEISEEVGGDAGEISEEVGDDAGEISEEVGDDAGKTSEEIGDDAVEMSEGVSNEGEMRKAKTAEETSQKINKDAGQSRTVSFGERCSAAWATMKDFFIRHKRWIIACVLVIVFCIIGYLGYRAYRSYRLQQEEEERHKQQERERPPVASDSSSPPSVPLWQKVSIILGLKEAPAEEIEKPEKASASVTDLNHSDRSNVIDKSDKSDKSDKTDNIDSEGTSLFSFKSSGDDRKEDTDLVGDDVGAIAGTVAGTVASIVAAERKDADDGDSAGAGDAGEEVFNVSNNIYTYSDARAVCKALGARLATPAEVRSAHTRGADWCTYGWSEGQHALYPTQKTSWEKLQKNKKRKHDCGLPGLNGGYFENSDLRFGANCYGKKPSESVHNKTNPYNPDYISEEESRLQEQIDKYRNEREDIAIAPFNRKMWQQA